MSPHQKLQTVTPYGTCTRSGAVWHVRRSHGHMVLIMYMYRDMEIQLYWYRYSAILLIIVHVGFVRNGVSGNSEFRHVDDSESNILEIDSVAPCIHFASPESESD